MHAVNPVCGMCGSVQEDEPLVTINGKPPQRFEMMYLRNQINKPVVWTEFDFIKVFESWLNFLDKVTLNPDDWVDLILDFSNLYSKSRAPQLLGWVNLYAACSNTSFLDKNDPEQFIDYKTIETNWIDSDDLPDYEPTLFKNKISKDLV